MTSGNDQYGWWGPIATFQAGLTGLAGLGLLALPGLLLPFLGLSAEPGSVLLFRAFGASLIYVAVVHALSRSGANAVTIRAIAVANVVEDGSLAVLSTLAVLGGTMHATGWILAALFGGEVVLNGWILSRLRVSDAPA